MKTLSSRVAFVTALASLVLFMTAGCNAGKLDVASQASALTGSSGSDVTADAQLMAGSDEALPAVAAGTSTADGPGVPDDFTGTISNSMPLTPGEQAAVSAADQLSAARNPVTQSPVDRGFAPAIAADQGSASGSAQ